GTVVAVDNGSEDATADILAAAVGTSIDEVVHGQATWGFGEAVAAALDGRDHTEWLWLLHDDVRVSPDALQRLLTQTVRTPEAGIVVPMLVRPGRRRDAPRISELGASISHGGRRELGLEPGEIGQGQHDPEPVLGGSTCGMLIRWSEYERLGGFDPAIPMHRDGVDLGWRATLAGSTVITCPDARIVHRQASLRGLRTGTLAQQRHRTETGYDRFLGMRTVMAHHRGLGAAGALLGLTLGTLLSALGLLIGKRPEASLEELRALGDLLSSGRGTRSLRRRIRRLGATKETRRRAARLRPNRLSGLTRLAETVWAASQERLRVLTSSTEVSLDELTGDDYAGGPVRAKAVWPWVAGGLGMIALLIAGRRLVGTGFLTSTELLPAPDTVGAAVRSYLQRPAGAPVSSAPWEGMAAVASVIGVVPTWAAVAALWLAVPAACLAMAAFLQPFVRSARLRWAAALAYALLPALVAGYARGEVWLAVWAVLLPLYAASLDRWPGTGTVVDRLREPAWAALLLTVAAAIAPLAFVLGGVALVIVGVRRGGLVRAVVAALVPAAVLAPWVPALVRFPWRLLTGPDPMLAASGTVPAWQVFLGRTAGAGLPPLWLSAVVVGLLWLGTALATAQTAGTWRFAAGGTALVVLAALLSRAVVPVASGLVRPAVTMWLVAGLGCLVVATVSGLDQARRRLAAQSFGSGQAVSAIVVAVGAVLTAVSLGWFVVGGLAGPLHRGQATLPPYIADSENSDLHARTLIVSLADGQVSWLLHQADHTVWGDGETGLTPAEPQVRTAAETVVAQIAAARQDDEVADELSALGVLYVQVRGVTPDVSAALAASPGISRGGTTNGTTVFTVTSRPSRVLLVRPEGTQSVTASVDSGAAGTLLLSEAPDPRWQVSVGGVALDRTTSPDWRPAFALAGQSGPVSVRLAAERWAGWTALAQLVAMLLLALFAAPAVSRESDDFRPGRHSAVEEERVGRRSLGGVA
ncbi:MAG TPA: glycosyltransferase, partial [Propionibacteriaceae bacterium]|nr:glycosyltransferase [Propionibacteriaceae bacterium]